MSRQVLFKAFHLRLGAGPVWEICEEADSRARSWAHLEATKRRRMLFDDEKEEENCSAILRYGDKSAIPRLKRRINSLSTSTNHP